MNREVLRQQRARLWSQAHGQLVGLHRELKAHYRDAARCEHAWRSLKSYIADDLWSAVEKLDGDQYRQQLVDVLDSAVSELHAIQLQSKHLQAIDDSLAALKLATVREVDVSKLEDAWRKVGAETIPTLGNAFPEWLELSTSGSDDEP
ncbi:MAG: hypothetical protein AAGM22_00010 [Acidobacteriota bacterium]